MTDRDELAYADRSIALAFERRDAYHVECKAGYRICKSSLKNRGAYTASKAGRVILVAHYTNDTEQRNALQQCKDACAEDYGK